MGGLCPPFSLLTFGLGILPFLNMDYFATMVGQPALKRQLSFYVEGFRRTGIIPNLLFCAPRGAGKTKFSELTARCLAEVNREKKFIEINCSSLKNVGSFFNRVVGPYLVDRDATVLFDEASELPKSLTMALLTILNPNEQNFNIFTFDGTDYLFDFTRHTFLFATTEPQKIFHALKDRLKILHLEEYQPEHLAAILQRHLKDFKVDTSILNEVATVLRGSPRQAVDLGKEIQRYLVTKHRTEFDWQSWEELKYILNILPLGVNQTELSLMRYLCRRNEASLTMLHSKLGLTKESIQRDAEIYLLKNDLIEIGQRGRHLTQKGREYLKSLGL